MNSRRSDRVHVVYPIRGIGVHSDGTPFDAAGRTVVISRNGAAIILNHELAPAQVITVRRLDSGKEAQARVIKPLGGQGRETIYGVAFLDPAANLWDVEFRELSGNEEPLARLLMRCDQCRALEIAHLDEIEVQGFDVNEHIERYCKTCATITPWRRALTEPPREDASSPEPQEVESKPTSPGSVERRKHKRVSSSAPACVRQFGRPDEVVVCENLSRGGLCFRSRTCYEVGSDIDVAVSYIPGSGNIFVPARIVNVTAVEDGFRCSTAYITTAEKRRAYDGAPVEITNTR